MTSFVTKQKSEYNKLSSKKNGNQDQTEEIILKKYFMLIILKNAAEYTGSVSMKALDKYSGLTTLTEWCYLGLMRKLYLYHLYTQPQSLLCFPLSCVPRNIFPKMACVWNIQQMGQCQDSQSCYYFCVHRERQWTVARKTQQFSGQKKQTLKENNILPESMFQKIIKTSDNILLCPDGISLSPQDEQQ